MKNIKLPLALDKNSNKLIHISEIAKDEIGNFNFVCPACETELIVKMGEKNIHHFAHKANCGINGESLVHLLGKKIISENNKIVLPIYNPVTLRWQEIEHEYTFVESEIKHEDIIPDVVIKVSDRLIFLEIANTHFIDDEKLQKLKRINIETWEIEVNSKHFFDYETLTEDILRVAWNKSPIIIDSRNYRDCLNMSCIQLANENLLYKTLCDQHWHYKANTMQISKSKKFPLDDNYNYFRIGSCDGCEDGIDREEFWIKIEKASINVYNTLDVNVYIYVDVKNNLNDYWCAEFHALKHKFRFEYITHVPKAVTDNPFGSFEKEKIKELYETIEFLLNKKANNMKWDKYDYGYSLYTPLV